MSKKKTNNKSQSKKIGVNTFHTILLNKNLKMFIHVEKNTERNKSTSPIVSERSGVLTRPIGTYTFELLAL